VIAIDRNEPKPSQKTKRLIANDRKSTSQNKKFRDYGSLEKKWSGRRELNPRPLAPQASTKHKLAFATKANALRI